MMDEEEREKIIKQNRRIFLVQTKLAEMYKNLASLSESVFEMFEENINELYRKET